MIARAAIAIAMLLIATPAAAQDAAIELQVGAREARAIDVEGLRAALAREVPRFKCGRRSETRRWCRVSGCARSLEHARCSSCVGPTGRGCCAAPSESDPGERLETIVILAVNMVRDEASELLELLRRRRAVEADHGGEGAPEAVMVTTGAPADPEPDAPRDPAGGSGTEAIAEAPATTSVATHVPTEVVPPAEVASRPPGQRVVRIALGALVGTIPQGLGQDATLLGGLELAWTPTDFLALGVRDLGGGASPTIGRWSVGGALFGELGWVVDPALVLHLELGVDLRVNGASVGQGSGGVAPLAVLGARFFPIVTPSIAVQTGLHVVATGAWSTTLHVLPQGAVLWTGGISIAVHVS